MFRPLAPLAAACALLTPLVALAQTGDQTPAPPAGGAPAYAPPEGRPSPTPEMIAARQAARQACAADVAKLCPDAQPGRGGVMQCVRQHRAELSPGCGQAMTALRDARRAARS